MKFFFRIAFLAISFFSHSQDVVLFSEYEKEIDPKVKIEQALYLENYYLAGYKDSLKNVAVELSRFATKFDCDRCHAVQSKVLAEFLSQKGVFDLGLKSYKKALEYFEVNVDSKMISELYAGMGVLFYKMADYPSAAEHFEKSLEWGDQSDDVHDKYNALFGLGRTSCALGDTSAGITSIEQYVSFAQEFKKFSAVANGNAFLGQIDLERNEIQSALKRFELSLLASKKCNEVSIEASAYNNLAIVSFYRDQMDSSLYYFKKGLNVRLQNKRWVGVAESYYNLGQVNLELGYYDDALVELDSLIAVSRRFAFLQFVKDGYVLKKEVFLAKGDDRKVEYADNAIKAVELKMANLPEIEEEDYSALIYNGAYKSADSSSVWGGKKIIAVLIGAILLMVAASLFKGRIQGFN